MIPSPFDLDRLPSQAEADTIICGMLPPPVGHRYPVSIELARYRSKRNRERKAAKGRRGNGRA